jgi:peptidoglycan/LPS O-acetylase OafA/YrhL
VVLCKVAARVGLESDLDSLPGLVVKCAAAIAVASLSWYYFEKPVLSLKQRFRTDRPPASKRQPHFAAYPSRNREGARGGDTRPVPRAV